jgi:hypothetical protein
MELWIEPWWEEREKNRLNVVKCDCDLDQLDFDIFLRKWEDGSRLSLVSDPRINRACHKIYAVSDAIYAFAVPREGCSNSGSVFATLYRERKRAKLCSVQNYEDIDRYITTNDDEIECCKEKDFDEVPEFMNRPCAIFIYDFEEDGVDEACNCLIMISMRRNCGHGNYIRKNCFLKLIKEA